jgi:hypothetical protein
MSRFLTLLITLAVILSVTGMLTYSAGPRGHAQSSECWPGMKRVHSSMQDVQRIRVAEEEQAKILREVRDLLKQRKR